MFVIISKELTFFIENKLQPICQPYLKFVFAF